MSNAAKGLPKKKAPPSKDQVKHEISRLEEYQKQKTNVVQTNVLKEDYEQEQQKVKL